MNRRKSSRIAKLSYKMTYWVGTPASIVTHTVLFISAFLLIPVFSFDTVMLFITTIVSLEAIYLALFIQMSVNRQHKSIKELAADIDDILEDTEELTEEDKTQIKNIINKNNAD